MQEPVSPIQITLPVRQLVEFLRRAGSIDNRFTGFDRANEGARIHRKLQRAAVKEHADYAAEVFLRGIFAYEEIEFTLEGRADGIFTAADGVTVVDEIKTTASWQTIDAVKNGRIYLMPEYAKAWGYPMPEAMALGELWMAKTLYPDRFADIDMEARADSYYRRFYRVPNKP